MKKLPYIPLLTFAIILIIFSYISTVVGGEIRNTAQERLNSKLDIEAQNITISSERLLAEHASVLRAARALFASSEQVTRDEWQQYYNSLDIKANYPSITALTYIKRVEGEQRQQYIEGVINDRSISPDGYPDFKIHPQIDDDESYVVHFVEPGERLPTFQGLDVFSVQDRREAIEIARDTNQITVTRPIVLTIDEKAIRSFLVMIPVYQTGAKLDTLDERREAMQGAVVLAVRSTDFFNQVFESNNVSSIDKFAVDDITMSSSVLLPEITRHNAKNFHGIVKEKQSRINIGTRIWLLSFSSYHRINLIGVEKYTQIMIFALGVVIASLVTIVLLNSRKLRDRAEEIAQDLTQDLKKFKLAIESVSEQIVITDPQGIVLYANPATAKITGFTLDEVKGTKAGKLWGNLMSKDFYQKMWQVIKEYKKIYSGELKNKKKNGEEYEALLSISPILDENNEVIFFVAVERDITGEKRIANIKNQFITLASHQLRTPLSSMKWNLEMLSSGDAGKLDKEQTEIVQNIYKSNLHMISLVNSLLNISQVESGRIVIDPEPTDIISLAKTVIEELKDEIEKRGVEIKTEFVDSLKPISIDPQLIKEAYKNVLTNAVKYSTKGGVVTIKISTEEGSVITQVSDTGLGIPENEQDQIFKKFHRGSNIITSDTDGTGLGLFMTKIIVESSGGKIWFNSAQDKGTTFWFTLPIEGSPVTQGVATVKESSTPADK